MSEVTRSRLLRGRSVRFRLLAIALLPTLVILPVLLGVTIVQWNARFNAMLISKVNGDLTIAHQYLARLRAKGVVGGAGRSLRILEAAQNSGSDQNRDPEDCL